jgi:hypothetical protein
VTGSWPLFDLRIDTPRVSLRYPEDDALELVAQAATTGIHDADAMPFYVPWSRAQPVTTRIPPPDGLAPAVRRVRR